MPFVPLTIPHEVPGPDVWRPPPKPQAAAGEPELQERLQQAITERGCALRALEPAERRMNAGASISPIANATSPSACRKSFRTVMRKTRL
jgi:hypothetical protein